MGETVNVGTKGTWPVKIIKDGGAFPEMAEAQAVLSKWNDKMPFKGLWFGTIK